MTMATVFPQLRAVIANATGIVRTFAVGETGQYAIPDAINEYPAALLLPGNMVEHLQIPSGLQKHTYTVTLQILASPVSDIEARAIAALPFIDNVLAALAAHVQLNGTVTNSRLTKWDFGELSYGGTNYMGYDAEITVEENLAVNFVG